MRTATSSAADHTVRKTRAHGQRYMRSSSLQVRFNIHLSQSVTMAAAPAFITHLGAATPGAHVSQSYGGNLSATFSEAARLIRQRAARARLIDMLGGPSLTASAAETIDAEQTERPHEPKKSRRARAA